MTLKCDLDVVYKCYMHENTSKESQEHVFEHFEMIRPFPADPGHESHRPKWQKSQKKMELKLMNLRDG